jgi:hypothetical protein
MFHWVRKRKSNIWGGYSPRRGIQNGNKDTQIITWQLFLLLQLFICLWYLELLLACCGSPITLATKLNNIPLPSTFTYYFCWFSSLFHILFVEGSTFGSHFQSMLLWLFYLLISISYSKWFWPLLVGDPSSWISYMKITNVKDKVCLSHSFFVMSLSDSLLNNTWFFLLLSDWIMDAYIVYNFCYLIWEFIRIIYKHLWE